MGHGGGVWGVVLAGGEGKIALYTWRGHDYITDPAVDSAGVGWILDRTESDLYPRFLPNGGPDFTNPANYRPAPNGLQNANNKQIHEVKEGRVDLRYDLPIQAPVFAKAGLHWREQHVGLRKREGMDALPAIFLSARVQQESIDAGLALLSSVSLFQDNSRS